MPNVPAAKVRWPPRKSTHVDRPRLESLLTGTIDQKLTVVVAPAGFGKTTLLASWAAAIDAPVAWVSLDSADDEPSRFLHHLVSAVAHVAPDPIARVRAHLEAQPQASIDRVVGMIVEGVDAASTRAIVVFDDFHVIASPEIHAGVATLVATKPSTLQVVIATRIDPPVALARLRARGELNEIRVPELRFTRDEAQALLRAHGTAELSAEQIDVLESRTEGWAAGLQLVALALRGRPDADAFIERFGGRHRFIFDYLVAEVLARQTNEVQDFLTATSILTRLTGPLCDAVLNVRGSDERLRYLERANLFVFALDDVREWFRYHRLFADVLHDRLLKRAAPSELRALHLRASRWFEQEGHWVEAVDHALASGDVERAANLVEARFASLVSWGELATFRGWLALLPHDVVHRRPLLLLMKAWCTFLPRTYEVGEVHALLDEAEQVLSEAAKDGAAVGTRSLFGTLAAIRTAVSSAEEDAPTTLEFARQARAHFGGAANMWSSVLSLSEGLAHDASGDARAAERALDEAIVSVRSNTDAYVANVAIMNLARVRFARGALRAAVELCEHALASADDRSRSPLVAYTHVVLGRVNHEVNDLDAAEQRFREAVERGLADGHVRAQVDGCIGLALVHTARGDANGADAALGRARTYGSVASAAWSAPLVAWHRALLALRVRDLADAARHVASARTEHDRTPDAAGRSTHAIEARLLGAEGRLDAAFGVANAALVAAEAQGRTRNALEVSLVLAQLLEQRGRADESIEVLGGVLARAEQEGHVRLFLDEGEPMRRLLRRALDASVAPTYAARLIASFATTAADRPSRPSRPSHLVLNDRELSVLRLMAGRLSDREIAQELALSVSTIKWYSQRIFATLGVHRRGEAVARAKELGIL